MSRPEAALLLAGLPSGDAEHPEELPKHTRETLKILTREVKSSWPRLESIGQDDRLRLLGLAMPERPADYWEIGPDVNALAAGWIQVFGERPE
jgi:hypothetical protein